MSSALFVPTTAAGPLSCRVFQPLFSFGTRSGHGGFKTSRTRSTPCHKFQTVSASTHAGPAGPWRHGLGALGARVRPDRAGSLATAAATVPAAAAAAATGASSGHAAAETAALGALTEAAREVVLQVVLPLVFVWLLQQWLERLEERTLQEMHSSQNVSGAEADAAAAAATTSATAGADGGAAAPKATAAAASSRRAHAPRRTSLMRRLFSGLPSAPSRLALIALTVTHVARSLAEINKRLAERGLAEGWLGSPTLATYVLGSGRGADVVEGMRNAMAALDHGLVTLYKALLVGVCTWVVVSWKDVMLSRFLVRRSHHHSGEDLERILTPLNTVATWALVVCAGVLVVSLVGVDVRPLLVLTGGGGVVAGLASQQLLSNAVSGLQMYMDRPFRVGDTIAVQGVEGEVVDLSALRTHVLTSDGCIVAIPNRSLAEMVITNKSQSSRGGTRPPWMETRTPLSVTLRIRLRPATYDRMWAKMDDLKTAIINTGAVEAVGSSAPVLEVQSFTDRGVLVQARLTLRNPHKGPAMASSLLAKSAVPAPPARAALPTPATPASTATIVVSADASKPSAAERAGSAASDENGNSTGEKAAAASALGDADWVSFTVEGSPTGGAFTPSHTPGASSSSNNGTGPAAGDTASSASSAAAPAAHDNGVHHFPGGLPPTTAPSSYFWPPSGGGGGSSSASSTSSAAADADGMAAAAGSSALAAAAPAAAAAAGAVAAMGSGGGGGGGSSKAGKSSHSLYALQQQQQQQQQQQEEEGVSRETVRVMRQQLLLNLGPWLQAHNATLWLGD